MSDSSATAAAPSVHFQNTVEDWPLLKKAVRAEARFADRWRPVVVLIGAAVALGLPGTVVLIAIGRWEGLLAGWGVLASLLAVLILALINRSKAPDPKHLRPATMTLYPDFLEVVGEQGWERRDWSHITRLQAADGLFIMYRIDGLVFAIPPRAFASPNDEAAFIHAARQFHEAGKSRVDSPAPRPWQDAAGPPAVFASDTMQVSYSAAARELREMKTGLVLHPVDEQPQKKRSQAGFWSWLLFLIVFTMIFVLYFQEEETSSIDAIGGCVLFLGTSALMIWPLLWLFRFVAMRWQKPPLDARQSLTISPSGVSFWAPGLETRTSWETIDAISENERVIAFAANRPALVYPYVIPKSAFADEDESRRFAETAARYRRIACERMQEREMMESSSGAEAANPNPYAPPRAR